MLTASKIFIELKYSNLVSYLYGLMRRITPYCNMTVTLFNTLHYHKWALILRFVFLCSVIF